MGFLMVNDKYLSRDIKPIEFCILAKVEEFEKKGMDCYISNENFAKLFNVSRGTIINSINKLIEKGLLEKVNKKYNGRGKDIRILTIPDVEKNSSMGTKIEPIRVQNLNPTHTKIEPHGCKNCTPPIQKLNPMGTKFEYKQKNKTNNKKHIKKQTNKTPTQEEFKEFFKKRGYEMLADDFYKYCNNEKGWENIKNWRAFAQGYINNPYDLTKSKEPNKPKTTKKNHHVKSELTQEDKNELKKLMNTLHE